MASVTKRASVIKQLNGGYISSFEFEERKMKDGIVLNEKENIHDSIIGLAADYSTRFSMGTDIVEAFKISLQGANLAESYGVRKSFDAAPKLLKSIKVLDNNSIINACKLVTFDAWYRKTSDAMMAKGYKETNPDKATVQNIQTLVKRSITFYEKYGRPTNYGFSFEPVNKNKSAFEKIIKTGKGSYGGYTAAVDCGDGDFLTEDTL